MSTGQRFESARWLSPFGMDKRHNRYERNPQHRAGGFLTPLTLRLFATNLYYGRAIAIGLFEVLNVLRVRIAGRMRVTLAGGYRAPVLAWGYLAIER
jgi:hypothetical protein